MDYVLCIPIGGFNDQLSRIETAISYCKRNNRILLVYTINSTYKVNIGNYFNIPYDNVISDSKKIREILYDKEYSIYPKSLCGKINDVLDKKINFRYIQNKNYTYDGITLDLNSDVSDLNSDVSENVIIYVAFGGCNIYNFFRNLVINVSVKKICIERYDKLKKPYIAIQIRNTDRFCDYELLYENKKDEINSAIEIYIATDDKNALNFFIDKGLPVKNFTTYPNEDKYNNLHNSSVDPHTKFIDVLSDIYICGMAEKLISSSLGGFIRLIKDCNENKSDLAKQFEIIEE